MKTEWQFFFATKDLLFSKDHRFKGKTTITNLDNNRAGIPQELDLEVHIVPDKKSKDPAADSTDSIFITLPLPYEKAKLIIFTIVHHIADKITFESGEFNIRGGLILGKHIPEAPQEKKEIGEKLYFGEAQFEEVVGPPVFDSTNFTEKSKKQLDIRLISQHNAAKRANTPIDKFLGFFKILESLLSPIKKGRPMKVYLKGNETLFNIFKNIFIYESEEQAQISYSNFVDSIVCTRHKCAHLKANKKFGYVPADPDVQEAVAPYLGALERLTYEAILNSSKDI